MINPYMQETEKRKQVHTYNRFPVIFEKGEGVYLYDTEGKKYLDFAAGIAVCGLGYGNPELTAAVKEQTRTSMAYLTCFYNASCGTAAEALKKASGMDRVFFTNSGTEANEGMLKAARKYDWKKKTGRYEFIAMEGSFHGRSMGALSVTEHEAYRTPFEPLISGVKFAKFNDLDSVKALISDNTCDHPGADPGEADQYGGSGVLKRIRKLCDEEGILLLFDEIQCGMGRTGQMFAWQYYGVKPDMMSMAGYQGRRARWGLCHDRGCGKRFSGARRPRDHLWRESAGMYSCVQRRWKFSKKSA